jgi:hypothetical protein
MKFYPSDWRADPMLRVCSLAARGLWAEMMCLMHEAEPYGSMLVNGKRINKVQLAALVGAQEKECSRLMLELEGAGVFSRDPDDTIYSRRMRRDYEQALKDKANGKTGGNPKLISKFDSEARVRVNPPDRPPPGDGDKDQRPEARDQKPDREGSREGALAPSGWPADWFDQFWSKYPNKIDRAGAMRLLVKVGKQGVDWSRISAGLDRYVSKTDDRPWCNPTTWIKQARWDEQPGTVVPSHGKTPGIGGSLIASLNAELEKSIQEDERHRALNAKDITPELIETDVLTWNLR